MGERAIQKAKDMLSDLAGGCSAAAWETLDQKHLWGRNFDYNKIAMDSKVTYIPKNTEFYTCGTQLEGNLDESTRQKTVYAALGVGSCVLQSTPVLYEGINEKGLMGGQLYYRNLAYFPKEQEKGKLSLQPPFAVTYFLTKCASVEEVAQELEKKIQFLGLPILGSVPPIHWAFSDGTGEMAIIESERDGVKIYRNTTGVMTNSPGYPWHRLNLLNYVQIRELDYDDLYINGERLEQYFSGSGALGMPGDWSSPSRFIRLSFLKKYGVKGKDEKEGIHHMFRLFQSAAFPLGMVRVTEPGIRTGHDTGISPYDYTVYTSVMCSESGRFYWNTYGNLRIQYADLNELKVKNQIQQFELSDKEDYNKRK